MRVLYQLIERVSGCCAIKCETVLDRCGRVADLVLFAVVACSSCRRSCLGLSAWRSCALYQSVYQRQLISADAQQENVNRCAAGETRPMRQCKPTHEKTLRSLKAPGRRPQRWDQTQGRSGP